MKLCCCHTWQAVSVTLQFTAGEQPALVAVNVATLPDPGDSMEAA